MDISAVNSTTSAYGGTNQSSKVATTNQSGNVAKTVQADSVSISQTAQNMSKVANFGYDLPYDERGFELFQRWKTEPMGPLSDKEKPIDQLLPESQRLIEHFQEKMRSAKSVDEREQFSAKISHIQMYGDETSFKNESEVDKHRNSKNLGMTYLFHDISQNPVDYPHVKNNSEEILRDLGFRFDLL